LRTHAEFNPETIHNAARSTGMFNLKELTAPSMQHVQCGTRRDTTRSIRVPNTEWPNTPPIHPRPQS
jgi:hypothetical protein